MALFGAIVRTVVNTALLPVELTKDIVMIPVRMADDEPILKSTQDRIETLKDEADEEN